MRASVSRRPEGEVPCGASLALRHREGRCSRGSSSPRSWIRPRRRATTTRWTTPPSTRGSARTSSSFAVRERWQALGQSHRARPRLRHRHRAHPDRAVQARERLRGRRHRSRGAHARSRPQERRARRARRPHPPRAASTRRARPSTTARSAPPSRTRSSITSPSRHAASPRCGASRRRAVSSSCAICIARRRSRGRSPRRALR